MEELLKKQYFYNNLDSTTKKLLKKICETEKKKKRINNIIIYAYLIIGFIFLLFFKDIMFKHNYAININSIFSLCKLFLIISDFISIINIISKKLYSNSEKAKKKLKEYLIFEVCICKNKCTCKKDLINFLTLNGIPII